MRLRLLNAWGLLILMGAAGCRDARPVYIEPRPVSGETAKLQGAVGVYIDEVDGARVGSAGMTFGFGWNTVTLMAGFHTIRIADSKQLSEHEYQGSSFFDDPIDPHQYRVHLESDQFYEVEPASPWRNDLLRLTNEDTHESEVFHSLRARK